MTCDNSRERRFLGMSSAAIYGVNTLLLGVLPLGFAKQNKVSSVAGFLDFSSYLAAGFAAVLTGFLADRYGWNSVLFLWIGATVVGAAAMFLDQRKRPVRCIPIEEDST